MGFDEVTAVPHTVQQKGLYGSLEEARILELISHAPTRPQHKRLFLEATLPEFPHPTLHRGGSLAVATIFECHYFCTNWASLQAGVSL